MIDTLVVTQEKIATFAQLTLRTQDASVFFSVVSLRAIEAFLEDEFKSPLSALTFKSHVLPATFVKILTGDLSVPIDYDAFVEADLPYTRSTSFFTCLHLAAFLGHTTLLTAAPLLSLSNETINKSVSVLAAATWAGHMGCVTTLATRVPSLLDMKDTRGSTPFHIACCKGILPVVRYLYEKRPGDIMCVVDPNISAVWAAAHEGHVDVVKYLVETHPSILSIYDTDNSTALSVACREGKTEVVKYLLTAAPELLDVREEDEASPLHIACIYGWVDIVTLLSEMRPDMLDGEGSYHSSALLFACIEGQLSVVRYLVSVKPSLLTKYDIRNRSPLYSACREGHLEVATYLIEVMPSLLDVVTLFPISTPLHAACECGNDAIIALLIEMCPRLLGVTGDWESPLILACKEGRIGAVRLLLAAAPGLMDVCGEDVDGVFLTPAMYASQGGHEELAKMLSEWK